MSPDNLAKLRKGIVGFTSEFMIQNVNRAQQPSEKEVAEYVASKLGMPVELVERVRDGMERDLKKELFK
jgi:SH3-like domain-containing protein